MKYYVVSDPNDPGMEFDSYESARKECVMRQKEGQNDTCILSDDITWTPSWDKTPEDRFIG